MQNKKYSNHIIYLSIITIIFILQGIPFLTTGILNNKESVNEVKATIQNYYSKTDSQNLKNRITIVGEEYYDTLFINNSIKKIAEKLKIEVTEEDVKNYVEKDKTMIEQNFRDPLNTPVIFKPDVYQAIFGEAGVKSRYKQAILLDKTKEVVAGYVKVPQIQIEEMYNQNKDSLKEMGLTDKEDAMKYLEENHKSQEVDKILNMLVVSGVNEATKDLLSDNKSFSLTDKILTMDEIIKIYLPAYEMSNTTQEDKK